MLPFPRPLGVWILSIGLAGLMPATGVHGAVSLVSTSGSARMTSVRDFGAATTSADGRFLLFLGSGAVGDPQRVSLYRRALPDGATERVEVASSDAVTAYSASADGRRVAFACSVSAATPAGRSPYRTQVYLKDFETGELRLVSADAGGLPGDGDSAGPVLSADGRRLLFESQASNLVTDPDTHRVTDVFLYEVETRNLRLLSRAADGTIGDLRSESVALNADGTVAVFRSDATHLPPPEPGLATDLYVWNAATQSSRRISLPATGSTTPRTFNVVLSPDGRRLAFRTDVRSHTPAHGVWWFDLETWTGRRASESLEIPITGDNTAGPVMAAGGNRLAFETLTAPGRTVIWDADTGLHTLDQLAILALPNGGAPAQCRAPVLSPGGERLSFVTDDAVPAAGVVEPGDRRVYVRRLLTGETWTPLPGTRGAFESPFVEFVGGDTVHFQTEATVPGLGDGNVGLDVLAVPEPGADARLLTPGVAGTAGSAGNRVSHLGSGAVSRDGLRVVFTSAADNLVAGDTNGRTDVFVRNLADESTQRVSVRTDGGEANGESWTPRISGNGRFVVFVSTASNLVNQDTNASPDIFVRDLVAGTTALVSARDGGTDVPIRNGGSVNPVISADGRLVAFEGAAVDLVPGIALAAGGSHIFLRDLQEQRTRLLSVNLTEPFRRVEGRARSPMISEDGATVAFVAGNPPQADLYLHSVAENRLEAASEGSFGNLNVAGAALSADGSRAVFFHDRSAPGFRWRDLRTGVTSVVPGLEPLTDITEVAISGNGRRAAFVSTFRPAGSSDTNRVRDVFVVDLDTGTLQSASAPPGGGAANGPSDSPVFSADGRRIAFRSQAGNLEGDPTAPKGAWNIVVRDLDTDQVTVVSRQDPGDRPGMESSGRPNITADGRAVFFESGARLVREDANGANDVFLAAVPDGADPDGDDDFMPDEWERFHFGTRDRDGLADFDGDGSIDRDEYVAGTDPKLSTSVFRVLAGTNDAGASLTLSFPSVAGVNYRLEVSPALSGAAFTAVGTPVAGTGDPLVFTVPVEGTSGFVRVAAVR